jgi:hypothetical protein
VPKPEVLLHVAVRDATGVAPLLQQLEAMSAERGNVEWKTRKVGEHEIRFCNLNLDEIEMKLSPCYVLTEKALLIGSDTAVLVSALRQGDKPEESFAAQPDFKALQATAAGRRSRRCIRCSTPTSRTSASRARHCPTRSRWPRHSAPARSSTTSTTLASRGRVTARWPSARCSPGSVLWPTKC